MFWDSLFDDICCWLDDLHTKIEIINFKLNKKIRELEEKNDKEDSD